MKEWKKLWFKRLTAFTLATILLVLSVQIPVYAQNLQPAGEMLTQVEETTELSVQETDVVRPTVFGGTVEEATEMTAQAAREVTPVALNEELSKEILRRAMLGIETYQREIYISDLGIAASEEDAVYELCKQMVLDNPQYFWIDDYVGCCATKLDDKNPAIVGAVEFAHLNEYCKENSWKMDIEKVEADRKAMMSEVALVRASLPENATDLEKAFYAFRYLVDNVEYDSELANQYTSGSYSADEPGFSAYGALVNHKAVCQGFMSAYNLVMKYFGIEVKNVVSWENRHGWNVINLEGEWYYVDCTWKMFLKTEQELRALQAVLGSAMCMNPNATWYLYSGRDLSGRNGDGDTNLPPVPTTNAYEDYIFEGQHFIDGYWITEESDGLYYTSMDGYIKMPFASSGDILPKGIHKIYYAVSNDDNHESFTYLLRYLDTLEGSTYYTGVEFSCSPYEARFENGTIYSSEGEVIYTMPDTVVDLVIDVPVDLEYEVGDHWNPAGLQAYIVRENNSVTRLQPSQYTVEGFDSTTIGSKWIIVRYNDGENEFTRSFKINVSEKTSDTGLHMKQENYILHKVGDTAQIQAEVRGDSSAQITYKVYCDCDDCTDCSDCYNCSAKDIVQVTENGKLTAVGKGSVYVLVSSETETKAVYVSVYEPAKDSSVGDDEEDDGESEFTFSYKYNAVSLTATLTGISGGGSELIIPSTTMLGDTEYNVTAVEINQWSQEAMMDIIQNQITSLVIPDSVKRIGSGSFQGDFHAKSKLKSVTLPKECVIEGTAFAYTGLESLTLGSGITLYDEYGGSSVFSGCTSLKEVTIDTENITASCFEGCTALTTINWGNSIKTIQQHAFSGCTSLKNVVLPNGLERIGNYAFYECYLESLSVPATVTEIGTNVIYDMDRDKENSCILHLYCTGIKTVEYIKNSLVSYVFHGDFTEEQVNMFKAFGDPFRYEVVDGIDPGPEEKDEDSTIFKENRIYLKPGECYQLKTDYYDLESLELRNMGEAYYSVNEKGFIRAKALGDSIIMAYDAEGNFLESVNVFVYDFAFSQKEVKMQLGETFTLAIEGKPYLFEGANNFEDMIASIDGSGAIEIVSIEETQPLKYENNPLGVYGLVTIKAVNLGNSTLTFSTRIDKIKTSCHIEVTEKKSTFSDGTYYYKELADGTLSITGVVEDEQGFWFNDSLCPYVETIESENRKIITIPSKVKIKGKEYKVTQIAENALNDGELGVTHYPNAFYTVQIVIEEGIEKIGNYGISYFSVHDIILPSTLKEIGTGGLAGNELKQIVIPGSVDSLGNAVLAANRLLQDAVVMSDVERLPDGTFYDCNALKSVSLSNGIKVLGESAFENCTALKEIALPDSVEWIEQYVFKNNVSLSKVLLPYQLKNIYDSAFTGCTGLKEVYLFCPDFRSAYGYMYLFESAYKNITFFVSDKYDNALMLESMKLTEYNLFDSKVEYITVSGKADMAIGEVQKLTVDFGTTDFGLVNSIKWISGNEAVAKVVNGVVQAIGEGTTAITATTLDGKSATYDVRVFADLAEEKVERTYGKGIYVVTNVMSTLGDIELQEGWSFVNEEQELTASNEVQYFEAYYEEDGETRRCELPVYVGQVDSVSVAGRTSLAVGQQGTYRLVLNGTGITDGFVVEPDQIQWNDENAQGMTFTEDFETGNLIGIAENIGTNVIEVRVSLSETVSFQGQLTVDVVEEVEDDAYGNYHEPDFTVKNGDYTIGYRLLSETEAEAVSISGHVSKCEIPESVEWEEEEYIVTRLNLYSNSRANAGLEVSELILPGTIREIQPGTFKNFSMLQKITISGSSEVLTVGTDGALYNKDQSYLFYIPWGGNNAGTFVVPKTVEDMDSYELCSKIEDIDFEQGGKLQILSLTANDISEGYGGIYTADGKKMLKAPYQMDGVARVPYGVEEIAPYAFMSMWAPEIRIPSTVSLIDSYAFYDTENGGNTQKIYFEEGSCLSQINAYAFRSAGITHLHLPKSVDYIGIGAFAGIVFDEFSVGESISTVGESAFLDYYAVERYKMYHHPELKLMKENYISYILDVEEQTASVVRIENEALELHALIIPENVTFEGVSYKVTKIEGSIGRYGTTEGEFPSDFVTAVQIPSGVKEIANLAFAAFKNLCRVDFAPDSELEIIGEYAFHSCSSLQTLILPDSVTTIEEYPEMINDDTSYPDRFLFTNYEIDGLESLAGTVKIIGTDIFENDGYYWEINNAKATVFYVSGEAEGTVPDSFTNTGREYPVTTLRKYAFGGTLLKEVHLPETLTTIGQGAFIGSSLEAIRIPANVASVELGAFVNSYDLQSVLFEGSNAPGFVTGVVTTFENCTRLETIMVPKDSLESYQEALKDAFVNVTPKFMTFTDYVKLTDFELHNEEGTAVQSLTMTVGQKVTLKAEVTPQDTTDSTSIKWEVQNPDLVHVRDNTITALAAGKTVVTATVSGIKKDLEITIEEAKKQTADIVAPVLSGSLDEKNRIVLRWEALEGADGFALYRSLSPDGDFVRVKLKLSGNRTTTLDTNVKNHTTYYYKLAGYKQNTDGSFAYGAFSNVVTVTTKYTGEAIEITGWNLSTQAVDLNVGESCELTATLLPVNHTQNVEIRYTSENPAIIDLDKRTGQWIAKNVGNTQILVEVVNKENGTTILSAKCPVKVKQTIDLTALTENMKLCVIATEKNLLKDIKIPQELSKELEKYDAIAEWKNPDILLRNYIGNVIEAELVIKAEENSFMEFLVEAIKIQVAEVSDVAIETDITELYLDQKNKAVISYEPVFKGNVESNSYSVETKVTETTKLGLVIQKITDKNEFSVTVDSATQKGTAKVKVESSVTDKYTGATVYKTEKILTYMVKECEQGVRVTNIARIHGEEIYTGATICEELQPGDLLVITAESYGFTNAEVTFATADKKILTLKESSSNSATFEVPELAEGITKITITAKGDKKIQKTVVCAVKNYKPVLTTTKLSLDKNKIAGAELTIHPSYGAVPEKVSVKTVSFGKNVYENLFVITLKSGNVYDINLNPALSDKEITDLKNGTYKVVLQATWKGQDVPAEIGTVSIKVSASKPNVKVKQTAKVNLFYANYDESGKLRLALEDSYGKMMLTGQKAEIRNVEWSGSDFTVSENGIIRLKDSLNKSASQLDKKITAKVTFEGYRDLYTVTKTLNLQVVTTKPKVTVIPEENVWYTYLEQSETPLTVTDSNTKKEILPKDAVSLQTDSTIYDVIVKEDRFYLTLKAGATPKTENVKWSLKATDWKEPVTGKTKITVDSKLPAAKLSSSKLTLNAATYAGGELWMTEQAVAKVTIANAKKVAVQGIYFKPKNTAAKNIGNKISLMYEEGRIKASLNDKVGKGSYTYTAEPVVLVGDKPVVLKPIVITVSVIQSAPSINMKAKGSIDILQRDQTAVTYTPTIKNLNGEITNIQMAGPDANQFVLKENENGSIQVQAKEGVIFRTDCKYQIQFVFTLKTEKGIQQIATKMLSIKVKQGKVSLKAQQTDGIYPLKSAFKENGYALNAKLSVLQPQGVEIQNIRLIDTTDSFELLNWTVDENGIIHMPIVLTETEARQKLNLKLKKTYKLKLEVELKDAAGNLKPVSTNLKIKVVQ